MAQIATFAASPGGRLYAHACELYSVDPAVGVTDDPFEAANLRAALAVASIPETESETDSETDAPADSSPAFAAAKAATAEAFPHG